MFHKLKYLKYKKKYLGLKQKSIDILNLKNKKQQIGGEDKFNIGDLVKLDIYNTFFIIKNKDGKKISISPITDEEYLDYIKKKNEGGTQEFMSGKDDFYKLSSSDGKYKLDTSIDLLRYVSPINKLKDYTGTFSNNLYMFTGHGYEMKSSNIPLKKNQKIILLCKPLCSFYIDPPKDWQLVMNSGTPNDFIENLKTDTEISDQLCVFEGNVPEIVLYPSSSKYDLKHYRWGLYKIPVKYELDQKQKERFLHRNLRHLNRKEDISKKVSIHDLSRKRPYLNITSMHMYDNYEYYEKIYLSDVINDIEATLKDKKKDKEGEGEMKEDAYAGAGREDAETEEDLGFTLVLFVCRSEYFGYR